MLRWLMLHQRREQVIEAADIYSDGGVCFIGAGECQITASGRWVDDIEQLRLRKDEV